MKVAFWNAVSLSDNVTNHVAAIGTILSLEFKCEVVLGSNFISNRMLQDCFYSKIKEAGVAHAPYRLLYESPEYNTALWQMKKNRQGNILEIPMDGITIIFPPDVTENSMFYFEVPCSAIYLLDMAEENSIAFQRALEEAELVIVFLPPQITEIQKFFIRFSSLIPKAIFVIEDISKDKKEIYDFLASKYGISTENIGSISHSNEYVDACEEGRLSDFINQRRKQMTKRAKHNFLSELKSIAELLYRRSKYKGEEEDKNEQKL